MRALKLVKATSAMNESNSSWSNYKIGNITSKTTYGAAIPPILAIIEHSPTPLFLYKKSSKYHSHHHHYHHCF